MAAKKEKSMGKEKRVMRTVEERVSELDKKIHYHEACLEALRGKKNKLLASQKDEDYKRLLELIKASGKDPAEIAAMLKDE